MGTPNGVPNPEPRALGRVLQRLRRERGWTQFALAEKADLPRSTIARYESGRGDKIDRLPFDAGSKIAMAFGIKSEELKALIDAEEGSHRSIEDRLEEAEAQIEELKKRVGGLLQAAVSEKAGAKIAGSTPPRGTKPQKKDHHA